MIVIAEILVSALALYAMAGLLFAIAFLSVGIRYVDPAANGTGLAFRLILLPGVAALWPFLLTRWLQKRSSAA